MWLFQPSVFLFHCVCRTGGPQVDSRIRVGVRGGVFALPGQTSGITLAAGMREAWLLHWDDCPHILMRHTGMPREVAR